MCDTDYYHNLSDFLCYTLAKSGNLRLLHFLVATNRLQMYNEKRWHGILECPSICWNAARYGQLQFLRWCVYNGASVRAADFCAGAAFRGHLHILKWARKEGFKMGYATCESAAEGGQLHILKWLRAQGYRWGRTTTTCSSAAKGGHLGVLKWARANGCDWGADTCRLAADYNHLDVLQWASSNGAEWDGEDYMDSKICMINNAIRDWIVSQRGE